MSSVARILDRLERVRQTGPARWIACCPAHEDRSPSLSIREADDGRVLLHDFGECDTTDILSALGLTLRDLFDKPIANHFAPTQSRIPASDVLQALDHEIVVAVLILDDIVRRRKVSEAQVQRLTQSAARIGAARDMVCPARVATHA